jgi:hypothetical protein
MTRAFARTTAVLIATLLAAAIPVFEPQAGAATPAPLPRIAAPVTAVPHPPGFRRLIDTSTDAAFVPRGMNYVRLASAGGKTYHSTFESGQYDAARAEAFLAQMQRSGYNVVRVFIDPGSTADAAAGYPHGVGRGMSDSALVHEPYLDNVADFVRRATTHRIYVLPVLDLFPQNAHYYRTIIGTIDTTAANVSGSNLAFLHLKHYEAKKVYLRTFLTELRERVGAPMMSTLLAVSLTNEATLFTTLAPFHRMQGTFRGPDGITYDMSVPSRRQQAADSHIVIFASQMVDAVRSVEPELMVTMGVSNNLAMGRTGLDGLRTHCESGCNSADSQYWYPARAAALARYSRLSFLDVHIYPRSTVPRTGASWTLDAAMASIEWSQMRGVVVLGEFGVFRSAYGGDVTKAAYAARDHQVATCEKGFNGSLFWTWDTTETAKQQELFAANHTNGAINGVLAPIVRPDPCRP